MYDSFQRRFSSCSASRQQSCNLRSFEFSAVGTEISDDTGTAMASVLRENQTLEKLSFEACETEIGDSSGIAFASCLSSSSSLRSLTFLANFSNISEETCRALAESIGNSTSLQSVEFAAIHVLASGATSACLENALQKNSGLHFIKFETCQDGDGGRISMQEVTEKAMQKHGQTCQHKPDCPCFHPPLFAQYLGEIHQNMTKSDSVATMLPLPDE